MDPDELNMRERRKRRCRLIVTATSQSAPETMHQVRYAASQRSAEDQLPVRAGHSVLAVSVFARTQHWIDIVQDALVDLANQSLVDGEPAAGQPVREREAFGRREDFERVLLSCRRRSLEDFFDLEIAEAIPPDSFS